MQLRTVFSTINCMLYGLQPRSRRGREFVSLAQGCLRLVNFKEQQACERLWNQAEVTLVREPFVCKGVSLAVLGSGGWPYLQKLLSAQKALTRRLLSHLNNLVYAALPGNSQSWLPPPPTPFLFFIYLNERERDISLLFHLIMRSLVVSCMCPAWGANLQPWRVGLRL